MTYLLAGGAPFVSEVWVPHPFAFQRVRVSPRAVSPSVDWINPQQSPRALGTWDGSYNYAFDAENRMKTAAGINYTYDGDGKRVQGIPFQGCAFFGRRLSLGRSESSTLPSGSRSISLPSAPGVFVPLLASWLAPRASATDGPCERA